jgi:hypothetical protein
MFAEFAGMSLSCRAEEVARVATSLHISPGNHIPALLRTSLSCNVLFPLSVARVTPECSARGP